MHLFLRFSPREDKFLLIPFYLYETWNPMWGVETIIIGLISFMMSEEITTGVVKVKCSSQQRKEYARQSLSTNYKQSNFIRAFPSNCLLEIGANRPSIE